MICRRPVSRRVRSTRVVRNHPTQRCTRTRRHVRPEAIPMRPQEIIKLIQDHPRTDAHSFALQVELTDLAIMPCEIDYQSVSDRTAGQTRACPSRNDRYTRVQSSLHEGASLLGIARKSYRQRLDLVDGCIGRIKLARQVVK